MDKLVRFWAGEHEEKRAQMRRNIWTRNDWRLSLPPEFRDEKRPVRLRARTPPFHGGDTGSNPVRATANNMDSLRESFFAPNRCCVRAFICLTTYCKYVVSGLLFTMVNVPPDNNQQQSLRTRSCTITNVIHNTTRIESRFMIVRVV
jgi:hypothetical protein